MERALFLSARREFPVDWNDWDRIYIGQEFCQQLLPEARQVEDLLQRKPPRLPMTLVTPYMTDRGLADVENLARRFLRDQDTFDEIVFNDWGVFRLLRDYPGKRVLGRLLMRQLRDPRILKLKSNRPEGFASIESLSISDDFLVFLIENGIERVELDTSPGDLEWLSGRVRCSLYRPYTYVTTTRLCPLANIKTRSIGISPVPASCSFECVEQLYVLKKQVMGGDLYLYGNTLFYRSLDAEGDNVPLGCDRIVKQQLP